MALSKADYINAGRADAEAGKPFVSANNGGSSWQAQAYASGYFERSNMVADARAVVAARKPSDWPVQSIAPTPAQQRRAKRIDAMTRGYIIAALWSSNGSDPDTEEELENLDDFEFSDEAKKEALGICTAFYDRHTTDLGAYAGTYKPNGGYDVWECAGHDLWLTAAGHGVGFWDRGLGRLGDRLTKATKAFEGVDVYISDAREAELGVPFHASWK
jgi:hypothetical protein